MIKKLSKRHLSKVNDNLHRTCSSLSLKKRWIIIIALGIFLGVGSVYITITSIYDTCKSENSNRYFKQEQYMKRLKLQISDSIKQFIRKDYEKK